MFQLVYKQGMGQGGYARGLRVSTALGWASTEASRCCLALGRCMEHQAGGQVRCRRLGFSRVTKKMSNLLSLLPLALMPALYAALVKLAAFLLRRTQLSWPQALLYGLAAVGAGIVGTFIRLATANVLPGLVLGALGIAIQLVLGGWYLGPRARTAAGEPIGFARGMLIPLLAGGIILVFSIGLIAVLPAQPAGQ